MSPFCLRIRVRHRAAVPARSSGEVKGEGAHPSGESHGLTVQSCARSSEGCCEQPPHD